MINSTMNELSYVDKVTKNSFTIIIKMLRAVGEKQSHVNR